MKKTQVYTYPFHDIYCLYCMLRDSIQKQGNNCSCSENPNNFKKRQYATVHKSLTHQRRTDPSQTEYKGLSSNQTYTFYVLFWLNYLFSLHLYNHLSINHYTGDATNNCAHLDCTDNKFKIQIQYDWLKGNTAT